MKKSQLKRIIREEIQKLTEAVTPALSKGASVSIISKLGNALSRTLSGNPDEWPQKGETYKIIGIDKNANMYGFKGKLGNGKVSERWHDIKWIDNGLKKGSIKKI